MLAQASSTRSIALSGKNLSVIYLFERVAAATSALSAILTPWKTSYLSLRPRRIVIVSSTVGSFTSTGWNLRSSAGSFSIYFLYSSSVVAPMQWSSPRARSGFKMFPASIAPSPFPAPTIKWSSSINKIILPSLFLISVSTALSLSSNSPRYFAPATKLPISSANTSLFLRELGTSPLKIRIASPSAMAVFPTPASPISTGLFLVFRDKILITLRISSSLPITGSSLFFFAISVRLLPYFFKTLYVFSGFSFVTLWFPRTSRSAFKNESFEMLNLLKLAEIELDAFKIIPSIICSTEI